MPFYGAAIVCGDDPGVRRSCRWCRARSSRYGFGAGREVRAVDVQALAGGQMRFTVQRRNGTTMPDLAVTLNLPGEHNVLNALAAIAVATELELPDAPIVKALAEFAASAGASSAMATWPRGDGAGRFTLIDDYGHHPVEMAAVLAAARGAFPGRRLVLAFQPHRYTRTRDCFEDFVKVLGSADAVLLTEVYAAGEAPDRRGRRPRAGARAARGRQGGPGVRRRRRRPAAGRRRAGRAAATWSSRWARARSACRAGASSNWLEAAHDRSRRPWARSRC
jgi:UDP-N-acetylmuramate--alanine ligase